MFRLSLSQSDPFLILITGFVTRATRRVPHVEHGTAYSSGVPEFTLRFEWGSCRSIFSFLYNIFQIVVCPFSVGQYIVCLSPI